MRSLFLLLLLAVLGTSAMADVLIPLRTIRAQEIVTRSDFRVEPVDIPGAWPAEKTVDGLEARVALYAGRPVLGNDLGPPAVVERNDVVTLVFARGGLLISAEGRALSRGGVGDSVRVMNLSSRTTVTGLVQENGMIEVR
ncbi:flagellar basal body P-ring formation chaperone FlgA [Marinibacterium profundimaris]|uniref:Flagella basal body P-ring formation protein FlgA n=1 Tax=Marinibacterium profundimaris TaxID=1679460 RepID=A0A225NN41_9RHOB|nr:flagellar basal body P-ring formation chaperone FlgA [Marinibacterium profundimaris]OWU75855.1 flagellar basal body P-ring biosynthesis protein FlgA [Marinibacterium profundimaris]